MRVEDEIIELMPALRGYAWVLTRTGQDVDDLVQDTLLKAIAKVDHFKPGTNLRGWLLTIMRNTFFNQVSRTSRMRTGAQDCVSGTISVPPTQEWHVRGNELLDAVARLPVHYREVLVLVVMLGESYESAAEICGVAMGTVKSRVNRARAMVVEDLETGKHVGPGTANPDGVTWISACR
ncbi:sigma-70 family RNA polymerase sigma factor [Rhodobacteraceae bacterium 2CG4]|uniref:Sigma-70 family RNA polymerase sigma factor n=1 Tax=Halovulum marinum TaxID=2662447 RepID=A0A6L5YZC5_9RHOB|nr:sigma-70 family RNA polymerase sigma factor [Halovulum marinum]MSU89205.1 sigma-70 family RNA polymerase sigma factor [Halovulum marinum]